MKIQKISKEIVSTLQYYAKQNGVKFHVSRVKNYEHIYNRYNFLVNNERGVYKIPYTDIEKGQFVKVNLSKNKFFSRLNPLNKGKTDIRLDSIEEFKNSITKAIDEFKKNGKLVKNKNKIKPHQTFQQNPHEYRA